MSEERVTEIRNDKGQTFHTHTTVIHDEPRRSGGAKWVLIVILLIAVIAGIYFFSQMSNSEAAKDNAISNMAEDVGGAAKDAGNAVENAADSVTGRN